MQRADVDGVFNMRVVVKMYLTHAQTPPGAALFRARGSMGPAEAEYLVERCATLPAEVQTLHIDLTALEQLDPSALAVVQTFAVRWHMRRTGVARVEFSALALRSSVRELIRRRSHSRLAAPGERQRMPRHESQVGTERLSHSSAFS